MGRLDQAIDGEDEWAAHRPDWTTRRRRAQPRATPERRAPDGRRPWLERSTGSAGRSLRRPDPHAAARSRTLLACIIASAVVFIDGTVVNVALPALSRDLHASLTDDEWIVDAYLLVLAALLMVGGSVGDVYGRRRAFRAGLVLFGITSTAVGLAPSTGVLIGARALQGAAGALLVPGSLAVLRTAFPDEGERGAAIGTWTAWSAATTAVGPLVGGLLVDQASWRLVFVLNVPILLVALWLSGAVPESREAAPRRLDVLGAVLGVGTLGLPVYALIELPRQPASAVGSWAPAALGLVAGALFIAHERRTDDPMLPLALFRVRAFSVVNVYTLLLYGGFGAALLFTSLYAQGALGYSALATGSLALPLTGLLLALSRRFGALSARVGPRPLLAGGALLAAAGIAWTGAAAPGRYAATLLPGVALLGLGMSMAVAPLTAALLQSVAGRHAGVASGTNNAASRVAMLVAVAAIGAAAAASFSGSLQARPGDRALRAARDTPFAAPSPAAGGNAPRVRAASQRAYRTAIGLAALEALAAAGVALTLSRRPRPAGEPVGVT